MSTEQNPTPTNGSATAAATIAPPADASAAPDREKLTKKAITADHPTWCPGCPECFRGAHQTNFELIFT